MVRAQEESESESESIEALNFQYWSKMKSHKHCIMISAARAETG